MLAIVTLYNFISCSNTLQNKIIEIDLKEYSDSQYIYSPNQVYNVYSLIQIKDDKIQEILKLHDEFYEKRDENILSVLNYSYEDDFFQCCKHDCSCPSKEINLNYDALKKFIQENSKYLFPENLTFEDYKRIETEILSFLKEILNIFKNEFDDDLYHNKFTDFKSVKLNNPLYFLKVVVDFCNNNLITKLHTHHVLSHEGLDEVLLRQMLINCYYKTIKLVENYIFHYSLKSFRNKSEFSNLNVMLRSFNEIFANVEIFFNQNYIDLSKIRNEPNSFSTELDLTNDEKRNSFYSFFLNIHRLDVLDKALKNSGYKFLGYLDITDPGRDDYLNYIQNQNSKLHFLLFDFRNNKIKSSIFKNLDSQDFLNWFQANHIRKNIYEIYLNTLKDFNHNFKKLKETVHKFNYEVKNSNVRNFKDLSLKIIDVSVIIEDFLKSYGNNFFSLTLESSMMDNLNENFLFCKDDFSKIKNKPVKNIINQSESIMYSDKLSIENAIEHDINIPDKDVSLFKSLLTAFILITILVKK